MSHARAMLEPCLTPACALGGGGYSFNHGFNFTLRHSVLPTDLLSSSVINSQFFASIFDLAQKLAR